MTTLDDNPATGASAARAEPRGRISILRRGVVLLVPLVVLLAVMPYLAPATTLLTLQEVLAFAVFATATNLLIGQGGLVSFGQAVFFGLGAYTVTLGVTKVGLPFWLTFVMAPVIGAVAAVLVGAIALRARMLYFALLTLAFSQFFYQIVEQNTGFTGGANGVFGAVVPFSLENPVNGYWLLLVLAVISMLLLWLITASPFGLVLKASRENRRRMAALGVSVYRHQLLAFTISGAFCALAGAMFVIHNQGSNAELFDWTTSGEAVLMAVIGGMYTFLGPALGAFVYQFGHDWLVQYVADWQLVLGAALLLIVVLRPDGLAGALIGRRARRLLARISGRTRRHDA
jgi:branched-chain amino acid transport system permease protein